MPLDWATTQNNLGNALRRLGERESGTARLEEAVAAYREALQEWTRERVPLDWATTQNNLGTALSTLGERESGTARLGGGGCGLSRGASGMDAREGPAGLGHDAEQSRQSRYRVLGERERGRRRRTKRRSCATLKTARRSLCGGVGGISAKAGASYYVEADAEAMLRGSMASSRDLCGVIVRAEELASRCHSRA